MGWLEQRHPVWRWPLRILYRTIEGQAWVVGAIAAVLFFISFIQPAVGLVKALGFHPPSVPSGFFTSLITGLAGLAWPALAVGLLIYGGVRAGMDEVLQQVAAKPQAQAANAQEMWEGIPSVVQALPAGLAAKIEAHHTAEGTTSLVITTSPTITGSSD